VSGAAAVATSTAGPLVRYERRGPVALLTIDHPPVNVLSASVLDALRGALARAESDRGARAVVLAGAAERAFAAGANIKEMAPMGAAEAHLHGGRGQGVTTAIEALPLPVIAAVHGSCLGGGCEIALACDFILASDDAKFGQPEINLGVMPGWGGTRRLPRRIGAARARAWILTGRSASAQEALEQGLVLEVVPRAELLARALALAEELASKPATALAAAKFALQRAIDPSIHDGLAYELHLWSELFETPDQKEGMAAFLEKRAAKFEERPEWEGVAPRFPREPARPRNPTEGEAEEKRKN
jgi:enoyl-CoA hydratase